MKSAVIYARYSSERQTEQSIEGQLRVCNEFAVQNGLTIVDTYIDRAMTGTNDQRAAFQKMLADSDKPQPWDIVLVYALDRFGRNSIEVALNKQRLKKNGKILISATQRTSVNIDGTQNLDGIILENVLIGLSEYYSAELSQKIRRGQNESRKKGNYLGGIAPFGYKIENKKFVVDENNAKIVQMIFERYASGKVVREILEELASIGLTYNGKAFTQNTIYRTLRLEKYIGIYRHKDEIYTETYPQIVPTDLFNKVQAILRKNRKGSFSKKADFLLKGKLVCGLCGMPINGESGTSHTGVVKHYYKCSNRKRFKKCDKENIKQTELENLILETTFSLLNSRENIEMIADAVMQVHKKRLNDQTAMKQLISQRAKKQKSLENVMQAIEDGIYTTTTKNRLQILEEELQMLNDKIVSEQCRLDSEIKRENIIAYLEDFSNKDTQTLIDLLIRKIIVHEDRIEIHYNYIENNEPDEPETERRDFSLSNRRKVTVTDTHFYIIVDIFRLSGKELDIYF